MTSTTIQNIENLLIHITEQGKALMSTRSHYADKLSPDFNPFQFMKTDENSLSRLIAWLLNPKESHAQGAVFLEAYLQVVKPDWIATDLQETSVNCEVLTNHGRRIDILISHRNWTIGIENKLRGAGDQKDQVDHYLQYLDKLKSANAQKCLIYLTTQGAEPSEYSLSEDHCALRTSTGELLLSCPKQLISWLKLCRGQSRSNRVTNFIEDFEDFLNREILGIMDTAEIELIVDLISKNSTNIAAAFRIQQHVATMQVKLFSKLIADLQSIAPNDWRVTHDGVYDRPYMSLCIHYPETEDIAFTFEFQGTLFKAPYYGICSVGGETVNIPKNLQAIKDKMGTGYTSVYWPWYGIVHTGDAHLDYADNWRHNSKPWEDIRNGTMAKNIMLTAQLIHSALYQKSQSLNE